MLPIAGEGHGKDASCSRTIPSRSGATLPFWSPTSRLLPAFDASNQIVPEQRTKRPSSVYLYHTSSPPVSYRQTYTAPRYILRSTKRPPSLPPHHALFHSPSAARGRLPLDRDPSSRIIRRPQPDLSALPEGLRYHLLRPVPGGHKSMVPQSGRMGLLGELQVQLHAQFHG